MAIAGIGAGAVRLARPVKASAVQAAGTHQVLYRLKRTSGVVSADSNLPVSLLDHLDAGLASLRAGDAENPTDAGATDLPVDRVATTGAGTATAASGDCDIAFQVRRSLLSATATALYLFSGSGLPPPAATDANGRNAAWSPLFNRLLAPSDPEAPNDGTNSIWDDRLTAGVGYRRAAYWVSVPASSTITSAWPTAVGFRRGIETDGALVPSTAYVASAWVSGALPTTAWAAYVPALQLDYHPSGTVLLYEAGSYDIVPGVFDALTAAGVETAPVFVTLIWDGAVYAWYVNGELAGSLEETRAPKTTTEVAGHEAVAYIAGLRMGVVAPATGLAAMSAWAATQYALESDPAGSVDTSAAVETVGGDAPSITLPAVTISMLAGQIGLGGELGLILHRVARPAVAVSPGLAVELAVALPHAPAASQALSPSVTPEGAIGIPAASAIADAKPPTLARDLGLAVPAVATGAAAPGPVLVAETGVAMPSIQARALSTAPQVSTHGAVALSVVSSLAAPTAPDFGAEAAIVIPVAGVSALPFAPSASTEQGLAMPMAPAIVAPLNVDLVVQSGVSFPAIHGPITPASPLFASDQSLAIALLEGRAVVRAPVVFIGLPANVNHVVELTASIGPAEMAATIGPIQLAALI